MSAPPCHVLVTRPEGQQHALCALLVEAGFQVSYQPALAITPRTLSTAEQQCLINIDQYHAVFFVSSNAARLALEHLGQWWPQWPLGVHWLAVGDASAALLQDAGLPVQTPSEGADSEALLALPCLQQLEHQRVLVCRGETGRELFTETLVSRGATVELLPLYQRHCYAGFVWPATPVSMLLVSSLQGWQCMVSQVPDDCRIIVASERIAETVRHTHGHVWVAESAHDRHMLKAALQIR